MELVDIQKAAAEYWSLTPEEHIAAESNLQQRALDKATGTLAEVQAKDVLGAIQRGSWHTGTVSEITEAPHGKQRLALMGFSLYSDPIDTVELNMSRDHSRIALNIVPIQAELGIYVNNLGQLIIYDEVVIDYPPGRVDENQENYGDHFRSNIKSLMESTGVESINSVWKPKSVLTPDTSISLEDPLLKAKFFYFMARRNHFRAEQLSLPSQIEHYWQAVLAQFPQALGSQQSLDEGEVKEWLRSLGVVARQDNIISSIMRKLLI